MGSSPFHFQGDLRDIADNVDDQENKSSWILCSIFLIVTGIWLLGIRKYRWNRAASIEYRWKDVRNQFVVGSKLDGNHAIPEILHRAIRLANLFHHSPAGQKVWTRWIISIAKENSLWQEVERRRNASRYQQQGSTSISFCNEADASRLIQQVMNDETLPPFTFHMQTFPKEFQYWGYAAVDGNANCHVQAPRLAINNEWLAGVDRNHYQWDKQLLLLFVTILHESAHVMLLECMKKYFELTSEKLESIMANNIPSRSNNILEYFHEKSALIQVKTDQLCPSGEAGFLMEQALFGAVIHAARESESFNIRSLRMTYCLKDNTLLYVKKYFPVICGINYTWLDPLAVNFLNAEDENQVRQFCSHSSNFRFPADILHNVLAHDSREMNLTKSRSCLSSSGPSIPSQCPEASLGLIAAVCAGKTASAAAIVSVRRCGMRNLSHRRATSVGNLDSKSRVS